MDSVLRIASNGDTLLTLKDASNTTSTDSQHSNENGSFVTTTQTDRVVRMRVSSQHLALYSTGLFPQCLHPHEWKGLLANPDEYKFTITAEG